MIFGFLLAKHQGNSQVLDIFSNYFSSPNPDYHFNLLASFYTGQQLSPGIPGLCCCKTETGLSKTMEDRAAIIS